MDDEEILYERQPLNVYNILEKLGYSKTLAEKRVQIYRNTGKGIGLYERKKFKVDYDVTIVGSRGDGTGIYIDSDIDKLLVQNQVECTELENEVTTSDRDISVFKLETEEAPSGYACLRFITNAKHQSDKLHENILQALEDRNGQQYLRNDCILSPGIGREYMSGDHGWIEHGLVQSKDRSGPSQPYKIQTPFFPSHLILDDVLAFKCISPSVRDAWCNRNRTQDWPSTELIDLIRNMDVYVVPVGMKGSDNEHIQWRICLTPAELALVQSFNDTQIKLLGALKLITKHHITPICSNITSYIIKTILFWQMEQDNCNEWNGENFKDVFKDSLTKLKTCIEQEELANYMIPERNMFQNKISKLDKEKLIKNLNCMIDECPYTLIKQSVLMEISETDVGDITDEIKAKVKVLKEKYLHKEEISKSADAVNKCDEGEWEKQQQKYHTSVGDEILSEEDERRILEAIPKRLLREQFVLAIFALKHEKIATVLKKLFEAENPSKIIGIIATDVFPDIKMQNPYSFFNELNSMDISDIYTFCTKPIASDDPSCVLL